MQLFYFIIKYVTYYNVPSIIILYIYIYDYNNLQLLYSITVAFNLIELVSRDDIIIYYQESISFKKIKKS